MSDVERMEDYIKSLWDIAEGLASYSGVELSDKEKEVVNYFIKQAERVEEQQKEIERLKDYCSKSANFINQVELENENDRLRKALETIFNLSKHDGESRYLDECYIVARKALNEHQED